MKAPTFYEVLTAAVADMTEHGFDDVGRVVGWVERLRSAAEASLVPEAVLNEVLRANLGQTYRRLVERGGLLRYHRGVPLFTVERLRPELRAVLDRRLATSRALVRLDRTAAVEAMTKRFSGWATSVPDGGTPPGDRAATKVSIRKPLAQLPFQERRLNIDQGAKFLSALNETVAEGGGALAAEWHSRYRVPGYDYREDHKERDGGVYLIRGSWAHEKGLVKPGKAGYYDAITKPAQEVFCGCTATYLYALAMLPRDMLTEKGRQALGLREAA